MPASTSISSSCTLDLVESQWATVSLTNMFQRALDHSCLSYTGAELATISGSVTIVDNTLSQSYTLYPFLKFIIRR